MSTSATAPKRGELREHILRTALHLFTAKGYFNTSVHDIQREAGVSIGSIYNHFGGKEGVARALYTDLVGRMNNLVEAATERPAGASARCRALIQGLFETTESDPEVMSFILNAKHREFLPDENPICSSEPFARMRDIVQQGMDSGEFRSMELMVAASCAYGPALRMISLRLDGLVLKPLPSFTDSIWDAAWRSIRSNSVAVKQ